MSGSTSGSTLELAQLLAESYVLPGWRQPWSFFGSRGRREGAWLAGIALFLVLSGLVPLTFAMMTLLSVLAMATCLRAYALHEYARQLTELAMHEQSGVDDDAESVASGSAAAPAGGSAPARRRPRRPSPLLTAVAAARPLSLLNLRLSLMDRDFTEQDFDLLVRLDELEAASRQDLAPPPLPESQLALLPVHVHRSPTNKCKAQGKGRQAPMPEAALATPQKKAAAPPRSAQQQAAQQAQRVLHVPVLVEAQPPVLAVPRLALLPRAGSGGSVPKAATATCTAGSGRCCAGEEEGEIRAAYPCASAGVEAAQAAPPSAGAPPLDAECEEEPPLCSICLDPFEDGVKVLSLPCRHQYHADCVTRWLRLKGMDSTCPNCKGTVFQPEVAASDAPP